MRDRPLRSQWKWVAGSGLIISFHLLHENYGDDLLPCHPFLLLLGGFPPMPPISIVYGSLSLFPSCHPLQI
ncbi:hypothetical protein D8674_013548 [Pyrus ussuriensis x Pyrus communis]|uniref:Uncharacterized protein n=1 Tax=Pyrus ussuriensis x Pyrus communis TaxID=2448454 RepID=A0A5N5GQ45_9ROSA|nr:hypothetical protein D8674_013548 [Pyrus ussuriensis x Pyrus communis]